MDIHGGEKNYGRNDRASGGKEKSRTVTKGVFVDTRRKRRKAIIFSRDFQRTFFLSAYSPCFLFPLPSRLSSSRQLGLDYQFFPRLDTVIAASPFARLLRCIFRCIFRFSPAYCFLR